MQTKLIKRQSAKVKIPTKLNVNYELRGTDGKLKPLWAMNFIGSLVLRLFRAIFGDPIALKLSDGRIVDNSFDFESEENAGLQIVESFVKPGFGNYLAAYGLRVPVLFGSWQMSLNVANLVTSAGKAGVASRINGSGGEAAFTYIAVGTGTTAAAAGDTTLQTELATSGLSRANATASRVTTTVTNDTAQLVNTYTVTGTAAVTESGVLNAASVGTLLARQVFSAINVVNGDSLQITWKFSN